MIDTPKNISHTIVAAIFMQIMRKNNNQDSA